MALLLKVFLANHLGHNLTQCLNISDVKNIYDCRICPSYPKFHIVPAWTSDKDLTESARFRSIGRFPTIVWR